MRKLYIIGAGGHGKVVCDAALACGYWDTIEFVDDNLQKGEVYRGVAVKGGLLDLYRSGRGGFVFVAIGNNHVRLSIIRRLKEFGFDLASIIHPQSVVSESAVVSDGSVVLANAVVNASAFLGVGTIVNTSSVIEHDCVLQDCVHVSPTACLAGGVQVGECAWIGAGATVIHQIKIGKGSTVGAGAVVVADIVDHVLAVGVPAKVIRRLS